jgi:methionyl aminopeptidase
MINMGRKEGVEVKTDSRHYPNNTIWPARTIDRKASAQFEHTIGITDTGTEIFTLSPAGFTRPPYSA